MGRSVKAVTVAIIVVLLAAVLPRSVTDAARHQPKAVRQTIYVAARSAGENGRFLQTAFVLKEGVGVTVKATGTAYCNPTCPNDPNGITTYTCPITCAGVGLEPYSLIGKIGRGQVFFIGSGPRALSGRGRLSLAFNDNNYTDNSGGYMVFLAYRCKLGKTACGAIRLSRPPAGPVPSPTPTNTSTSTPTATPTSTATSTSTPTAMPTTTPTATPTLTPTATAAPMPTPTAAFTSVPTAAPYPTATDAPAPVYVPPAGCIPKEGDDDNDDHGKPPAKNDHDGCP